MAKSVRFLDDSGLPGFKSKFVNPPLQDRCVQWTDSGWTPRFMMRLWQERYRKCLYEVCEEEMNFWFSLGQNCGWDAWWSLYVIRKVRKERNYPPVADFSTFTFR